MELALHHCDDRCRLCADSRSHLLRGLDRQGLQRFMLLLVSHTVMTVSACARTLLTQRHRPLRLRYWLLRLCQLLPAIHLSVLLHVGCPLRRCLVSHSLCAQVYYTSGLVHQGARLLWLHPNTILDTIRCSGWSIHFGLPQAEGLSGKNSNNLWTDSIAVAARGRSCCALVWCRPHDPLERRQVSKTAAK